MWHDPFDQKHQIWKKKKTMKPSFQQTKYWTIKLKKKSTTQKDLKEERIIKRKRKEKRRC